ncbi:MAG: hypothetical protein KAT91_01715 [Candidatus Aenigmarchaeota archaeon]|nr:hypothetical protein [Candidatus Aenigmarchaeota archaeon]
MKKGMSAAMTLVITIIVLIVVALALITLTASSVGDVGEISSENTDTAACGICIASKCVGNSGTTLTVTDCPDCASSLSHTCP